MRNVIPRKTIGTRKFKGQVFYYVGHTIYLPKAWSVVAELRSKGMKAGITRSKDMGSLIWASKPVWVDLTEPLRNPRAKCPVCGKFLEYHSWKYKHGIEERYYCTKCKKWYHSHSIIELNPHNPSPRFSELNYIKLNNLYLAFLKGKEKMTRANYNKLNEYLAYAYTKYDTDIRNWWWKEFQKLPGWLNVNPDMKLALSMRDRYQDDLKAGHTDAAEYWRGQASAYFTGNPSDYHIKKLKGSHGFADYVIVKGSGPYPVLIGHFLKENLKKKMAELKKMETEEAEKHFIGNPITRISHCTKCKEPLYQMMYLGQPYPASQCLNTKCSLYGKPQSFKKGLTEPVQFAKNPLTCPKCHSLVTKHKVPGKYMPTTVGHCAVCKVDYPLYELAYNPLAAIGTAVITGAGLGMGFKLTDTVWNRLSKGKK